MIETYRGVVYPWQCDHMGHMNVMWYTGKFDEATWHLFAALGLTPLFMRENKRGMAAVRQEIEYKKEVCPGDILVVHSGVLEVKEKSLRFVHEMCNGATGDIVSITIVTGIHIDTQLRKARPFPGAIRRKFESCMIPYKTTEAQAHRKRPIY